MIERMKVIDVRLSPTMLSFLSIEKNKAFTAGITRRAEARHKRTFATRSSPAIPASARIGSGGDHALPKILFKLKFIVRRCETVAFTVVTRYLAVTFGPYR